jgi:hypothetical protein
VLFGPVDSILAITAKAADFDLQTGAATSLNVAGRHAGINLR